MPLVHKDHILFYMGFFLSTLFVVVINTIQYMTWAEYKILSTSQWHTEQLDTRTHAYRVETFKTEKKLWITQTEPGALAESDTESIEVVCDAKLLDLCNQLQSEQVMATLFTFDQGKMLNGSIQNQSIRLREIEYLDQNQHTQTFFYSHTPPDSAEKIAKQQRLSLWSCVLICITLVMLMYAIQRDSRLNPLFRYAIYLIFTINIFILLTVTLMIDRIVLPF